MVLEDSISEGTRKGTCLNRGFGVKKGSVKFTFCSFGEQKRPDSIGGLFPGLANSSEKEGRLLSSLEDMVERRGEKGSY